MVFNDVIFKRHNLSLRWIPNNCHLCWAGSSETGKDEQLLYYDKTNHPILVRNSVVGVCACLCYFASLLENLTVTLLLYTHTPVHSRVPRAVASVTDSYLCVASVSVHVVSELLDALNGWFVLAQYPLSWSALV